MAEHLILNENGSPQNQVDEGEVSQNELLF